MRTKTKDITDRYKNMRTSKVLAELERAELTVDEKQVFMLRLRFYNEGVSSQVGKSPRCVTKVFIRALNKLKDYLKDCENSLT
jgi:hypothetical protein